MRKPTRTYRRGETTVHPFTPMEDAVLTELRIQGAGTTNIAAALVETFGVRRSPATVNMRLKTLASRDEKQERW